MGPRHDEPRTEAEQRKEERQRRFQIVKLEERIAPCRVRHCTPGGCYTYTVKGPCHK